MKKFSLFSFFILLFTAGKAQFPVHPDSLYTFIRNNSAWKSTIKNWRPVDSVFKLQLKAAKNDVDTLQCFIRVLEKLNDVHSHFIYNNKYYSHFNPTDSFTLYKLQPLLTRAKTEKGQISTRMLDNGFVYVRIPSISASGTAAINQAAQNLYDSICQYHSGQPKGFVIDLRLNTGGNINAMLAGLSPVLGNGFLAFEIDSDEKLARKWSILDGDFAMNAIKQTDLKKQSAVSFDKLPVAVLTSPITASAGSMVAIAFRGRTNSASFGDNTADGYTTANGTYSFAPNLLFNFASGFVADRTTKVHRNFVPVDLQILKDDNFDNPAMDDKIITAIKWMQNR